MARRYPNNATKSGITPGHLLNIQWMRPPDVDEVKRVGVSQRTGKMLKWRTRVLPNSQTAVSIESIHCGQTTDDVISRRKNRMLELKMWDDLATRFPRSQRKGGLTHKGIQHTGPTARNLGVRIAKKWTTLVRVSAKHHTIAIYQKKRKKFARMGR